MFQWLCLAQIRSVMLVIVTFTVISVIISQCSVLLSKSRVSNFIGQVDSVDMLFRNESSSSLSNSPVFDSQPKFVYLSNLGEGGGGDSEAIDDELGYDAVTNNKKISDPLLGIGVVVGKSLLTYGAGTGDNSSRVGGSEVVNNRQAPIVEVDNEEFPIASRSEQDDGTKESSYSFFGGNEELENSIVQFSANQTDDNKPFQIVPVSPQRTSVDSASRAQENESTCISQRSAKLLKGRAFSDFIRPRWPSARDRELMAAKLEILNAPVVRNTPGLDPSAFLNVSVFKRSYELMERMLKVYIYKEGERPVFHQPKTRGIYASEGWFMKVLKENKKYVVKNPRKAHIFYLPFSSVMLRNAMFGLNFGSHRDLESYLKSYIDLISGKYSFWNRTQGADHFLVACHDWAPKMTRQYMNNCIRVMCNANVARGFTIGKDTSLPVTYIRSAQNPLQDIGGKPPSERHTLAFFAGGIHGYLRPKLLQYWENSQSDMKIFGPMPRDIEGKKTYREYMKSSRYCICARGYEVHTPRVVESIYYECVPVIISDNYVPPLLEVLKWEAFSVFVKERDVPNLRNILLSIPEEKYLEMQSRVKMVQQHFLWHKRPEKYDLFSMILHSVWYNRVFQMKSC